MIGHSDKSDQQVKFKQRYVPKSNLGIREEMWNYISMWLMLLVMTLDHLL